MFVVLISTCGVLPDDEELKSVAACWLCARRRESQGHKNEMPGKVRNAAAWVVARQAGGISSPASSLSSV